MGKQKGVKERTKGNRMPSNSSKTVNLISKQSNNGEGFIGFEALSGDLGYVPIFNDKESFENTDIDPDLRIVLRKLSKKDQTTKLKAIAEFQNICVKKPTECIPILPYWPRIYNRLSQDEDKKIREGCHCAMEALATAVGKKIAPYLKEVIAQWFLGLCDSYIPSAMACEHCLNTTFPGDKKLKAFVMYRSEIIGRILGGINNVHQGKISDDLDEQYRSLSESISAFALFMKTVVKTAYVENEIEPIFEQARFWKFMKHKSPMVRKAFYDVLSSLCEIKHDLMQNHLSVITKSVMHRLNEENILVCKSIYACAVSIVANSKNWFEHVDIYKGMLPQIFSCLKNGCYGLASTVCPAIIKLFYALPEGTRSMAVYSKFSDSILLCLNDKQVKFSKHDLQKTYQCYFEIVKLGILDVAHKSTLDENSSELFEFLKSDMLLATLKQSLSASTNKLNSNLVHYNLSVCLHVWTKVQSDDAGINGMLCDFLWLHISNLITEDYITWENSVLENNSTHSVSEKSLFLLKMLINPDVFNSQSHRHVSFEATKAQVIQPQDSGNVNFQEKLILIFEKLLKTIKFEKHKKLLHFYVTIIKLFFSYPPYASFVNSNLRQYFSTIAVPNTLSYISNNKELGIVETNDMATYCCTVLNHCNNDADDLHYGLEKLFKTEHEQSKRISIKLFVYIMDNKVSTDFLSLCISDEHVRSLLTQQIKYIIAEIGTYNNVQEVDVWNFLKICLSTSLCTQDDSFLLKNDIANRILLRIFDLIKNPDKEINSASESLNFMRLLVQLFQRRDQDLNDLIVQFVYFICVNNNQSHYYTQALKLGMDCCITADLCDGEFCKKLSLHIKTKTENLHKKKDYISESVCIVFESMLGKLSDTIICNYILDFINELLLDAAAMNDFFVNFNCNNWTHKIHSIQGLQPCQLDTKYNNIYEVPNQLRNLYSILQQLLSYLCLSTSKDMFTLLQGYLQNNNCFDKVTKLINILSYLNSDTSDIALFEKFNLSFKEKCVEILYNCALNEGGIWCYTLDMFTDEPCVQFIKNQIKECENILEQNQLTESSIQFLFYLAHKNLLSYNPILLQNLFNFISKNFCHAKSIYSNAFSLYTTLMAKYQEANEEENLVTLFNKLLEIRNTHEDLLLFNCDITKEDSRVVLLNCEFAKYISMVISSNYSLIASNMWDFAQCSLLGWIESASLSSVNIGDWSIAHYRFLHSVLNLLSTLHAFITSDKANNDPLLPHNLTTEWKEFFFPNATKDLLSIFINLLAKEVDHKLWEILFVIVGNCLNSASVNSLLMATENLVPKLTVGSSLPDNIQTVMIHLCSLLFENDNYLDVGYMVVIYNLLSKVIIHSCNESGGNTPFPTFLKTLNKLYTVLDEYPEPSVMKSESTKDDNQEELYSSDHSEESEDESADTYTLSQHDTWLENNKLTILRILFCWRLLINATQQIPTENKSIYLDALHKEKKNIGNFLLPFLIQILPNKSYSTNMEDENDLLSACGHLSWLTYKDLLLSLPVLCRAWYSELSNVKKLNVDTYTSTYITPFLCKDEIEKVLVTKNDFEESDSTMKIQARSATREVVAKYSLNEMDMEIVIKFSPNHPLCPVKVLTEKRASIVASQWRYWILQITTFLQFQNGSIVDGLKQWKKRVDKQFDGLEECMICFSMVHGTNQSLPKLQCKTCKKKYHAECLYKWFDTSNQSSCPLCRSTMIFR